MVGESGWECAGDEIGASGGGWVVVGDSGWEWAGDEVGASGGGWVVVGDSGWECAGKAVGVGGWERVVGGWEVADACGGLIGESANQTKGSPSSCFDFNKVASIIDCAGKSSKTSRRFNLTWSKFKGVE